MKYVYVVYDNTDRNFRKPYVAICRNEIKAQEIVDELRSTLPEPARCLVDYRIEPLR